MDTTRNRLLFAAALLLVVPSTAIAQPPSIAAFDAACPANDRKVSADLFVLAQTGKFRRCFAVQGLFQPVAGSFVRVAATGLTLTGFGTLDITGSADADPFITFGASTTNVVAGPVTYAFLFGTPIVPGLYNTATSSASVTVTDGGNGGSVVTPGVYPTYVSGYGTVGLVAANLGVDNGSGTCLAGSTCSYATVTNTFAPTFYDNLEALLTYQQTGLASQASWSGRVTLDNLVTATPEPATFAMLATGLAALGLALRRRNG